MIKNTPFAGMTLAQKEKVIFGPDRKYYTSKTEADTNIIRIKLKVWKYAKIRKKVYSGTVTLEVNKKLQYDVRRIFNTIYQSEERFPIKTIGAYNWRGKAGNSTSRSHHSYGTAIDINWEENYMVKAGKIISGKLYDPGNNRYSMPAGGIIVATFKEHGWVWGGEWKSAKDYMHFSFLGR